MCMYQYCERTYVKNATKMQQHVAEFIKCRWVFCSFGFYSQRSLLKCHVSFEFYYFAWILHAKQKVYNLILDMRQFV